MSKKLFILMFLILSSSAVAQCAEVRPELMYEEILQELPPRLPQAEIETAQTTVSQKAAKTTLKQKFHNLVNKRKQPKIPKIDSAKDIEPVNPQKEAIKTINSVKKEQKKQAKEQKKQEKKAKKEIKAAEKKAVKGIKNNSNEIPAVNNGENASVLTDTAYQGSVNTTRIIEVDECVKIALEKHPAIKSAMSNAEIYKSRIAQAWANYFPTFSAGVSYSRNDMQMSNFAFPIQQYDMFYTPTLSGNMLLFDFGKTKAQADLAKRTYEAAQFNLENSINTVIFTVKQAYYNLLFAQQQVKVYEDTVKDYTLHLEQAKAYYNIGTKAKIDVLTAEHNLGRAKLSLLQAQNTLKIAYVQLSNAMGMPDYSDYDVTDNLTTKAYGIEVNEAVNTAFETSPELLAAKKKADASELLVRASRRAFTPNISGFASYTRGGKQMDTDYGYQIGAQLNYQTVNLLQLKKQVDEAKATYKKDLADYENVKQTIYFQVKEAYLNMTTAQESIAVAKLSMDQAKEQYDQASGRYKVGLGDAIELKDAETTYRNSQLDYYNTLLNYHVSAANLEKLMGVPLKATDIDLL